MMLSDLDNFCLCDFESEDYECEVVYCEIEPSSPP